ncbi:MAG TPA: hypothetical protein VGF17_02615 [Phytomonospora sp.]
MRQRIITFIAMAVAAFGLLGSAAASAADAGGAKYETDYAVLHGMTSHDRDCYGDDTDWNANVVGCVMPHGDMFWLYDIDRDASSVKLTWRDATDKTNPRHGVCIDDEGYGDQTRCDKNLPEGHTIKWELVWWEDGEWESSKTYSTKI